MLCAENRKEHRFVIVGVPKETFPCERRVALVPAVVPNLAKAGLEVLVEAAAGVTAGYLDADYIAKGAKIAQNRADVFATADVIVQVLAYGSNDKTGQADLPLLRRDQVVIGFLRPFGTREVIQSFAATGVTSFATGRTAVCRLWSTNTPMFSWMTVDCSTLSQHRDGAYWLRRSARHSR